MSTANTEIVSVFSENKVKVSGLVHRIAYRISLVTIMIFFTGLVLLEASVNVRGVCTDDLNRPVQNVSVEFRPMYIDNIIYRTTTDSKGFFSFDSILEKEYQIRIAAYDSYPEQWYAPYGNTSHSQYKMWFGPARSSDTLKIMLTVNPVENPPSCTLTVHVVDTVGVPIRNCSVELIRESDRSQVAHIYKDSSVSKRIVAIQPDRYAICVNAPQYLRQYYDTAGNSSNPDYFIPVEIHEHKVITFKLTKNPVGNGTVTGKCLDDMSMPIQGLHITLYGQNDLQNPMYQSLTSESGTFSFLNIYENNYYLKISGNNYPDQWYSRTYLKTLLYPEDPIWTRPTIDTITIYTSLNPENNKPASIVKIRTYSPEGKVEQEYGTVTLIKMPERHYFKCTNDSITSLYISQPIKDGLYSLSFNIPTYPYQFYNPAGNTTNDSYQFSVQKGETLFVEVNLKRTFNDTATTSYAFITGKVTDSLGPIGNALISIHEKSSGIQLVAATTDSSGLYKPLRVPVKVIYLQVEAQGYPVQYWTIGNGRPTSRISPVNMFSIPLLTTMVADMKLVADPKIPDGTIPYVDTTNSYKRMVSGFVKNARGPLAGVRVLFLQSDHLEYGFSPQFLWSSILAYTDKDGKFVLNDPPQGTYLIAAVADSQNYVAQFYKNADLPGKATPMRIESGNIDGITFLLRTGGVVTGVVVNKSGNPVINARIGIHENKSNGRHYETASANDGTWLLQGIPGGTWNVSIQHELYLQDNHEQKEISVSEGLTTTVPKFTMTLGGRISGRVMFSSPLTKETVQHTRGSIQLFPIESKSNDVFLWSTYRTDVYFVNETLTGNIVYYSGLCPVGTYRMMYVPERVNWSTNSNSTDIPHSSGTVTGYSFFNNDTGLIGGTTITISPNDTTDGTTLTLKNGGSLFGTLRGEGVSISGGNYNVHVFIKSGNQYVNVSSSISLGSGKFEVPGLIEGERYYIKAWGDGYPDQFWSLKGKNSTYPKETIVFKNGQTDIVINLVKDPEGSNVDVNQYISLWWENNTEMRPVLKWRISSNITIDTMQVYTRSESIDSKRIASIPFTPGKNTYEYTDTRNLDKRNMYCVVGRGSNYAVRSDQVLVDVRNIQNPKGNIWIDVSGQRYGIVIEWGLNDTVSFTEKDSVVLYRRSQGGVFKEISKRVAFEGYLYDHEWNHADSLKTFEYMVELQPLGKKSDVKSLKLDNIFFTGLAREIRVGPNEKHTTIQAAINAAENSDFISVQSGTYREQLNFKGKTIGLHSQWNDNRPAILDASGGTAITIPVYGAGTFNDGGVNISGFKITNATIGIQTSADAYINRCLFEGCGKSVIVVPDSTGMMAMLLNNPFTNRDIYAGIEGCTFIATKRSSLAAVVQSTGSVSSTYNKEYEGQLIQPLKSIKAQVGIQSSLFAYFGTSGAATAFPVTLTGAHSSAWVDKCATWQTPVTLVSDKIKVHQPMVSFDPQFKDTMYYFCGDSSIVRKMGIGYNSDDLKFGEEDKQKDLTTISNLVIFNKSVDKIELRWSAAPLTDSIIRYRIYRLPGDTSLFYINEERLWDISIDKDSIFTVMDTFWSEKTVFVDSTIIPGKPYLYAVCSVDKHGNESPVRFPATKPVKHYFSNGINYELKLKAGQWTMISPWGRDPLVFDTLGNYILYQWDPSRTKDKLLSYYSPVRSMKPGIGYWIKSMKDTTIRVAGSAPAALQSVQDTLRCTLARRGDGWNQVASPFPHRVNPKLPSQYVMWEWIPDSMGYRRVSMMEPWKGYWIYSEKDTSFVINSGENDVTSAKYLVKRLFLASWELSVALIGKGGYDQDNVLGILSPKGTEKVQTDIPEPPQPFGGNHVYFVKKSLTENENRDRLLSHQYFRSDPLPKEKLEWQVGINSSHSPSTLSISGIETCPEPLKLFWVYKGAVTDLRKTSVIPIETSKEELFGYVVATANPMDIALYSMRFAIRSPFPNPSIGNVNIEYVIPYLWDTFGLKSGDGGHDVTIELYDMAGRIVRILFEGKRIPGIYTLLWDGKTQAGTSIGTGLYIVRFRSGNFIKNVKLFRVR